MENIRKTTSYAASTQLDTAQIEAGARSSAVERSVHIREVAGSFPAEPTKSPVRFQFVNGNLHIVTYLDGSLRRRHSTSASKTEADRLNAEAMRSMGQYRHSPQPNQIVRRILKNGFRAAQSRCGSRGTPINITLEFLLAMYAEQGGRCAITGIPFDVGPTNGGKSGRDRKPLRPSIDRIDAYTGYVIGNVRLVCAAVNYAMGPWGEAIFRLMTAYTPPLPSPPVKGRHAGGVW